MKYFCEIDMIGKDSVPFKRTVEVDKNFYDAMLKSLENKNEDSSIFTKANSSTVSEYLKEITKLDFVYPKMARTVLGSITFAKGLQKRNWDNLTDKEFKNQLMEVVFEVAKTLNHKKTVTKEQNEKIDTMIKEKTKKSKDNLKKLEKSTEEKLLKIKNDKVRYSNRGDKEKVKELNNKKKELELKLENAKKKYESIKNEMKFKSESREANLSTNLNAYSNPQLNYSLCKYANKDPSIIYSKTQLAKFEWAKDVDENYWKEYPNIKD